MAQIYKGVGGKQMQKWLADRGDVQAVLRTHAYRMASVASGILAEHRYEGHSFIEVEHGDVDYHVVLNDTRGLGAAMSIEYGRGPDADGRGATEGIFALHRATGAPVKVNRPRNRRSH